MRPALFCAKKRKDIKNNIIFLLFYLVDDIKTRIFVPVIKKRYEI